MPTCARYNPAAGVRSDFESLLNMFTDTNSVRYEQFSQIWRDKNMSCIFMGKGSEDEMREFITEAMRVAVELWMPTQSLQVRVGALYLLYAIYFKQIFQIKIKIPITLDQWKNALEFAAEIREQHHLDADYIFCKLRHSNAFHFSAMPNKLHMHSRVEDEPVVPMTTLTSGQDQHSILAAILPPENIDQLSAIHEQYHQMKCALAGSSSSSPVGSLDVIQPTLVQNITRSVAAFEEWRKKGGKKERKRRDSGQTTTSESEADSDVDQWLPSSARKSKSKSKLSATGRRRAEIRNRAFSTVSMQGKGRRHRQIKSESDKESSSSPSKRARKNKPFQSPTQFMSDEGEDEPVAAAAAAPPANAPLLHMPNILGIEEPSPELKRKGPNKGKGPGKQKLSKSPGGKGRGKGKGIKSPGASGKARSPGESERQVADSPLNLSTPRKKTSSVTTDHFESMETTVGTDTNIKTESPPNKDSEASIISPQTKTSKKQSGKGRGHKKN